MIKTTQVNEFIFPKRIIETSKGVTNAELLLKEKPYLAHKVGNEETMTLPNNSYIILDFGKEYSGGIRMLVHYVGVKDNSAKLRLRFGESLGEVMHDVGYMHTSNDHNHRDFYYNVPCLSDVTVGNTGFRFVRIDNVSGDWVSFIGIVLCYVHMDAKQIGYFECDDERINQIYDIATRTAFMSVQNGLVVEAIKRDRLVWAGDMNVQVMTLLDSYGDLDVIRNTIDCVREKYPLPGWMNSMPTYSLWWTLYVEAAYQVSGDKEWLEKQTPYLLGLASNLNKCVLDSGDIDYYQNKEGEIAMDYFIDWPSWTKPGIKDACVALTKLSLDALSRLLPNNQDVKQALSKIKKQDMALDAPKGLRALQEMAFGPDHPECLLQDGYKSTSTFLSYAIYKAMAKQGNTKEAIQIMKDFYGLMLDINATTFFEDYQPEWVGGKIDEYEEGKPYFHENYGQWCYPGYRLSLAHGWSAGPSPFLIEEVAGIKIIDSETYKIEPSLGDLNYVKAARATKYGPISVEIKKNNDEIYEINYSAPTEITIVK